MFVRRQPAEQRRDMAVPAHVWGGWMGVFYAGIWLFYLLQPIGDAWAVRGTWRGDVGIASTVLFAVVYLLHFMALRDRFGRRRQGRDLSNTSLQWNGWSRADLPRYLVLVALAALSAGTVGESGTATWVFLAVTGLWTFSMGIAFVLAGLLIVVYELLVWQLPGWQQDNGVVLAFALAMAAVSGGIVASRRQRELSAARRENARLAVEEERNRMARDLHDILGHSLTVITVKAELAGRLMEVAPERARAEVADLERLSRDALADVRRAVEGYREISLSGELARAREALSAAGIEARLPGATDEVPSDLRELFAWVVREGVTNVIRHSGARHCTISLASDRVTVSDDGHGLPPRHGGAAATSTLDLGNGLRGLRERAAAAGARVLARQLEPGGFSLTVIVPMDRATRAVGTGEPEASLPPSEGRSSRARAGRAPDDRSWTGAQPT
ncbi:MAG TPA: histidine kinase [Segeticoccus sp.]|uniref:sensor histidine kinase n=1 Tax=Segeticoccus sp. TaxID=2706531 RepID=UPI002D7EF20E|nr:histidine kinase [Segeticoccus sp.]HET8600477.1 histidine kinase [Segeticoccus sp.]